jgi:hypothetical protein
MPSLNATVYPAEAYVLVQTDWSGLIFRDTFTRIATQDWAPAADTGQVWALQSGASADFPVNGLQGVINHSAVATTKRMIVALNISDFDASGWFYNGVVPTGNDFIYQVMGRFVDINNLVDVRFTFAAAGTVSITLRQILGGVTTTSTAVIAGLPTSGAYEWRFVAQGGTIYGRLWLLGTPEPTTWNLTFAVTHLAAGSLVTGTVVNAGVTNPTPITFLVDNIVVVNPNAVMSDCAIVTRTNTVTGEVVNLRPYISYDADGALLLECGQGLWWDTEPPLNVPLEYCTFPCDAGALKTLNPDFEVNTGSWTAANGATLAQVPGTAKVGTASGRITPNGTTGGPTIFQSSFTLVANDIVTISTWAMSPQGWNGVLLRLVVTYSDLTSETLETPLVTLDDNEWRFLSASFSPRLPVTNATFSFIAAGIPPNTTLFFVDDLKVTQLTEVASSACETVTVASESVWLKNPLSPCLDVEIGLCTPALGDCTDDTRVSYAGTFDDSFDPNTVLLGPVNRRRPIPISRVRRDAAATLRLIAHDCEAKDAILDTNEPGTPLLFQAPEQYCIPDRYISVGSLTENRFSVDQRNQFRVMGLPYVTVDRPEGPADGPCGTRMIDLCDIYTSWGALAIAGLTWTDLLLGEASPNGPGQPAPPAAARTWGDVNTQFADWTAVNAGGTRDWGELRDGL